MTRWATTPCALNQAMAASRKATALSFFSSGIMAVKARREASSMAT